MAKGRNRKRKVREVEPHKKAKLVVAIGIVFSLIAISAAIATSQRSTPVSQQSQKRGDKQGISAASLNPNSPSKEYIYAGGRLVATEEPSSSTLLAPASLRATTTDSTHIHITWAASTGATKYEIQRSANFGNPNNGFSTVSSNITSTSYDDTVATNAAYIYRVRALDSNNPPNASPFSDMDLATAIVFTEDPVTSGVTTIKEVHITQLRDAIHYARIAAGITTSEGWTDPTPPPLAQAVNIKKAHIQDLRDRLGDARSALSFPVPTYTDPTITQFVTPVKAAHIQELRRLVKGYRTYIDQP